MSLGVATLPIFYPTLPLILSFHLSPAKYQLPSQGCSGNCVLAPTPVTRGLSGALSTLPLAPGSVTTGSPTQPAARILLFLRSDLVGDPEA